MTQHTLNPRQIALLRDFRMMGFMAFFDSPFRLEGPGLRELGMFEGLGDSTAISALGMAAVKEADAAITRKIAIAKATAFASDAPPASVSPASDVIEADVAGQGGDAA